jgi:hypothetical protein
MVRNALTAAAGAVAAVIVKNVSGDAAKRGIKDIAKRTLTEAAGSAASATAGVVAEATQSKKSRSSRGLSKAEPKRSSTRRKQGGKVARRRTGD